MKLHFFIGYDSKEDIAYRVCKNSLLKTLTYTGYKQHPGDFWRAESMNMINHQNGKSTELKWLNYTFNTGLTDNDFNRNALKRKN